MRSFTCDASAPAKRICRLHFQQPRRVVCQQYSRPRHVTSDRHSHGARFRTTLVRCKPSSGVPVSDEFQEGKAEGSASAASRDALGQGSSKPLSNADASEPQGQIAQAMDMIDESEDDMAPLLSALDKAKERAERMTKIRMANESEALEIAGMAIAMKDKVDSANAAVEETLHAIKKREEQLKRLTASKSAIDEEELRLSQGDALASVDSPMSSDAASVGDWDIGSLRQAGSRGGSTELSADAKAWTEIQAASMIIKERMNAYTKDLTALQGKLEGLNERVVEAEQQYVEADAAAAAIMTTTEGAVRTEMEAKGIYEQVRLAVEAAQRGKMDQLASKSVDIEMESEKEESTHTGVLEEKDMTDQHRSVAEATQEEIEKIDMEPIEFESESQEDAAKPSKYPETLMRTVAAVGAVAAAVTLVAITPIGPWLADEFAIVGGTVAKISALLKAIMERIPWPQPMHGEQGLWETITILFTSVIAVPSVIKFIPGGSAVLGFLIGGAVIGPFGLGLIQDVAIVKHLAEMGVVFLLFNIGLELSLERLQSLARVVFGMGLIHFVASTLAIAGVANVIAGYSGPCSIIVGGALALSSTAVAMQVLQERGETATRHGRATFAVLLLQDLAVVVLLMLVPLLSQGDAGGFLIIAKALGVAAIKAMVCITGIILTGRMLLRPLMRRIAALQNADIFAATTLLVILGCSALTQMSGLSLALGAFLAGLLMAETEYALQVESDIKPFKGLLLGLFFISAGMEISFSAFYENMPMIIGSLFALIAGKTALMFAAGIPFGLSKLSAARSGMYIAPGGEFAFVVLGEAAQRGLLASNEMRAIFFMVVLSMAITPYLAQLGGYIGKVFERKDVASLQPTESETAELKGHVIIMGFGRVGQTIAQLLSERLIPYVALDMRADRVIAAKAADLPVYFGDAGSPAVLQHVGAARAKCAVITLDTPGANYRSVWAMNKNFPGAKIFVRAHDVEHGLNLEQAGATAVVPEILEPSLQLAAAVLGSLKMKSEEVSEIIDDFRRTHMSELSFLTKLSGGSLGYGFDKDDGGDGTNVDGSVDTVTLDLGDDMDGMDDVIMAQPAPAAELKGSGA